MTEKLVRFNYAEDDMDGPETEMDGPEAAMPPAPNAEMSNEIGASEVLTKLMTLFGAISISQLMQKAEELSGESPRVTVDEQQSADTGAGMMGAPGGAMMSESTAKFVGKLGAIKSAAGTIGRALGQKRETTLLEAGGGVTAAAGAGSFMGKREGEKEELGRLKVFGPSAKGTFYVQQGPDLGGPYTEDELHDLFNVSGERGEVISERDGAEMSESTVKFVGKLGALKSAAGAIGSKAKKVSGAMIPQSRLETATLGATAAGGAALGGQSFGRWAERQRWKLYGPDDEGMYFLGQGKELSGPFTEAELIEHVGAGSSEGEEGVEMAEYGNLNKRVRALEMEKTELQYREQTRRLDVITAHPEKLAQQLTTLHFTGGAELANVVLEQWQDMNAKAGEHGITSRMLSSGIPDRITASDFMEKAAEIASEENILIGEAVKKLQSKEPRLYAEHRSSVQT